MTDTPARQPQQQRCETCTSFEVSSVMDSCPNEDYCGKTGCTITTAIWDWIKIHGCSSYTSPPAPAFKRCCDSCINVPCKVLNRVPCLAQEKQENICEENGCTDVDNCDEICQHSRLFSPLQMQEAKQSAAKAAHEQAIEQLSDLNRYSCEEYEEASLSDNEREMRIHLEYGNRTWGIIRSLRAQQGGVSE